MIVKIIDTTDGKYIGIEADTTKPFISPGGIDFVPTKVQDLGDDIFRYSNSNYVVLVKKIKD